MNVTWPAASESDVGLLPSAQSMTTVWASRTPASVKLPVSVNVSFSVIEPEFKTTLAGAAFATATV